MSKLVKAQNQSVINSMIELEKKNPSAHDLIKGMSANINLDSSESLARAIHEFTTIKALLARLVAS
jgi:hypothetical protein